MFAFIAIVLNARLARLDDRGASAVEYGLLIAGIAALIIVTVFAFGATLRGVFAQTCSAVAANGASRSCS